MGQNPFLRRFFVRKRLNINIYIYIYNFNDDLWWFFPNSLLFWPVRHGSPWRALRRDPCQADQGTIRVGAPIDLCWGWWLNGEITKIYIYVYTHTTSRIIYNDTIFLMNLMLLRILVLVSSSWRGVNMVISWGCLWWCTSKVQSHDHVEYPSILGIGE